MWDIIEDQYGRFWFATQDHGVFNYDGDTIIHYHYDEGLSSIVTLSLLEDKLGRILIGTYDGGLNVIENGVVKNYFIEETEYYTIWEIYEDSQGRIWCRTYENGVVQITGDNVLEISEENNLTSNSVLKVFEDSFSNIWFATENGLSKYGKTSFITITEGFVNADNDIISIYSGKNGRILAGSYSGLNIIKGVDIIETLSSKIGLQDDPFVGAIEKSFDGNLWLGTVGLTELRGNWVKHYFDTLWIPPEHGIIRPRDMVSDSNTIYVATEIGLVLFTKGDYKVLTEDDGLISEHLYSIAKDSKGRIWCGTANGLSVYDGKTFYNYSVRDGLPNDFCNDIAFDNRDVAWIGTDYGVSSIVLTDDYVISTRNYSVEDGLKSNSILSVLADKKQNIWLGHNKGVDYFNPFLKEVKNYGHLEGFLPVESNLGAIAIDSEDNVWFGSIEGIVRYSPQSDSVNKQQPKIYINSVNLYNDTTSLEAFYTTLDSVTQLPLDLRLPHTKKNIFFEYVGLHYTIVEKNTYKYRLLGEEENWSEITSEIISIPYRNLSQGKYTFQVLAANCDGVWTTHPAEFSFQILPPWWKTWWAIILQVIMGIGVLILIIYIRERKLIQDKKVLTQKVKERTIEIEKQKDKIEEQKKEITDSIMYAQNIQSAILPKDETISPLLKEYFVLFKPRDIVSGDFYWINGNENKVIAIAADCTGHGVPGAFMSMLGVSILNQLTSGKSEITAGEILNQLRDQIISTLSHTGEDKKTRDGMDMALCIIDFNSLKAEFAGAYNPLVIKRGGEDEAEVIKADKMPVGLHMGNIVPFTTHNIDLNKNDCLYMFSDGYPDQFGGPEGKKFKSAPFRRLLCEISDKPMLEQHKILDKTIEDWKNGYKQIDDILVIGIKIT